MIISPAVIATKHCKHREKWRGHPLVLSNDAGAIRKLQHLPTQQVQQQLEAPLGHVVPLQVKNAPLAAVMSLFLEEPYWTFFQISLNSIKKKCWCISLSLQRSWESKIRLPPRSQEFFSIPISSYLCRQSKYTRRSPEKELVERNWLDSQDLFCAYHISAEVSYANSRANRQEGYQIFFSLNRKAEENLLLAEVAIQYNN